MLNRILKTAVTALVAVFLVSCGGGGVVHGVALAMTDAPMDTASSVNISFSQVQFTGPSVAPFNVIITPASTIDLYQLQGGIAVTVIAGMQVQPGHYTNMRIAIASDPNTPQSNITLPDGLHNLYIPSGVSSQVDVPVDFTIASGGDVDLTMDFDLRKSIIQDPNDPTKYQLIPSIRAVETVRSGSITGSVATSLITCLDPVVYVYSGDVTPGDVDITGTNPNNHQPISTALVGFNQTTSNYNFTVGFLPPGEYTVAFTCGGSLDVANQSNTLTFQPVTHATVQAHLTTFIDLE